MDIWERSRETVADIVSAWRAVGREPCYVHATADGAVFVAARATDYSTATIGHWPSGWASHHDGVSETRHETLEETAAAAVAYLDACDAQAATVQP